MPSVLPALVSLEMEMGTGSLGRRVGCWRGVWASTRRRWRMARGEGGGEGRS